MHTASNTHLAHKKLQLLYFEGDRLITTNEPSTPFTPFLCSAFFLSFSRYLSKFSSSLFFPFFVVLFLCRPYQKCVLTFAWVTPSRRSTFALSSTLENTLELVVCLHVLLFNPFLSSLSFLFIRAHLVNPFSTYAAFSWVEVS